MIDTSRKATTRAEAIRSIVQIHEFENAQCLGDCLMDVVGEITVRQRFILRRMLVDKLTIGNGEYQWNQHRAQGVHGSSLRGLLNRSLISVNGRSFELTKAGRALAARYEEGRQR